MDSLATTLLFAVMLLGQVRLFCGVILRKCVNIHTTLSDIVILPPWVTLLTYIILRVRVFSSTVYVGSDQECLCRCSGTWRQITSRQNVDCYTDQHVTFLRETEPWFDIKMPSYQYRKSHCRVKTVIRSSYLHNGISLHWIRVDIFQISTMKLHLLLHI